MCCNQRKSEYTVLKSQHTSARSLQSSCCCIVSTLRAGSAGTLHACMPSYTHTHAAHHLHVAVQHHQTSIPMPLSMPCKTPRSPSAQHAYIRVSISSPLRSATLTPKQVRISTPPRLRRVQSLIIHHFPPLLHYLFALARLRQPRPRAAIPLSCDRLCAFPPPPPLRTADASLC